MAAKKTVSVSEFMDTLKHPLKQEVEAVRQIILASNDRIKEEVKWNAPSFYINDHFATFNLHAADFVQVIFHKGARSKDNSSTEMRIADPAGILTWLANDRCAARFYNMEDVASKKTALTNIINQWIDAIEP